MSARPALRLRPLGNLEVLDAAWLTVRLHWAEFYAVSSAGTLPIALLLMGYFLWLGRLVGDANGARFYAGTLLWAVLMTAAWTWNGIARGALTHMVLAVARGQEPNPRRSWGAAFRTAASHAYVALVAFGVLYAAGTLLVVPAFFLLAGWWVARPAVMEEERAFGGALRRSWKLTEGYRIRSLGLWLLFALVGTVALLNLHLLVKFTLGTAAEFLGLDFSSLLPQLNLRNQAYTMFLAGLVLMLLDPVKTIADTLFYLDLRIRREGADLLERLRSLRGGAVVAGLVLLLSAMSPAAAVPLDEYRAQIRELRSAVHAAPNARAVRPQAVESLGTELVEMPGGQKLTVDNTWVKGRLEAWHGREDKLALLRRLDALERSLSGVEASRRPTSASANSAAPPPASDPKEALKQILQEPEFQPLAERPELKELLQNIRLDQTENWWKSFWKWVNDRLFKPAQPPSPPQWPDWGNLDYRILEPVIYLLLAAVVIYLIVLIIRWLIERPLREEGRMAVASTVLPPLEASATENALDHSVDEWERFAQQWLGRGDVRQAVRALYLATLVHLHRERKIDYNRALTNWIYVRQFRGEGEHQQVLRQLTQVFDEVWYGERPCGEETYHAFERGVRSLGTPAPLSPATAGAQRG